MPTTATEIQRSTPRAEELMRALFAGEVEDAYPTYAELREIGDGVHWADALQAYIVCRYDDVRRIAADHKTFSSDLFYNSAPSWHNASDQEHLRYLDAASRLFMFADPPAHTRIRSSFRHAFTPQAVESWRPMVEQVTRELISKYERGVEFNIMPGFAADVPVAVVAEVLGVPADMRPEFRRWSYAYASTFDPVIQGAARDQAITYTLELFDYLGSLVAERRQNPRNDLITTLIATETVAGDHLGDVELLAQLALLLVAGNETTTTTIGSGLTQLFDNPDTFRALKNDLSLVPAALEEFLRIDPPLHFVLRKTIKETTLGDHQLPPETMIFPSPAAANRDPRRFADPDQLKLDRPDNKHLAFFHGVHFCVGAPLARMEGQVVFRHVLENFADIHAGAAPHERRTSNVISRGWNSVSVVL